MTMDNEQDKWLEEFWQENDAPTEQGIEWVTLALIELQEENKITVRELENFVDSLLFGV